MAFKGPNGPDRMRQASVVMAGGTGFDNRRAQRCNRLRLSRAKIFPGLQLPKI